MLATFVALLAGHVIADFLLQTGWMAEGKRKPGPLLAHVAIVTVASWAALGLPLDPIPFAVLAGTHLGIDWAKARHGSSAFGPFALDQAAHLAVIAGIASAWPGLWSSGIWVRPELLSALPLLARLPEALALLAGLVATVWAGGYAVKAVLTGMSTSPVLMPAADPSLPRGGQIIGRLERFLILVLVLTDHADAIGFLIAAKSVLRFNDLARETDRHVSEYVIIGTLASFAWALATAFATQDLLQALRAAP